jgi:predicted nucleic-acid-binding protein
MIALDTNILARYLLKDDEPQFARARAIIEGQDRLMIPVTVILELVWILEISDCGRDDIARALKLFLGLQNFAFNQQDSLLYAVGWYEGGMDFADALHLSMSVQAESCVTFDRNFAKSAKKLGAFPEVRSL